MLLVCPFNVQADDTVTTAVSSWISPEYQRERMPDGSLKPERYALLYGGRLPGTTTDETVDRVSSAEVAKLAVNLLAGQRYVYEKAGAQSKLLIVLHWGTTSTYNRDNYDSNAANLSASVTTMRDFGMVDSLAKVTGTAGPASAKPLESAATNAFETALLQILMENRVRDFYRAANASLLGFAREIEKAGDLPQVGGLADKYNELLSEIDEPRYYIIVPAYDLQVARQGGKPKLLWVTRVSVSARRNEFGHSVVPMLKSAAKYFGRSSGGLVRSELNGRVELGELKSLGAVEAKPDGPAEPQPESANAGAETK